MNRPTTAAKDLLSELGIETPGDMSMEEIAWACGLIV